MTSSLLEELKRNADPERAEKMRAYHKTTREVWGISNPQIHDYIKAIRGAPEEDLENAKILWQSGILEARIATGSLLTRGKLAPDMDAQYWQQIMSYAPDFDGWAIADHMAMAAHKRILAPENRYIDLKPWTHSNHLWTKRAAMVYTLPFARLKAPNEIQKEAIETILSWAAEYTKDSKWFIQKSVAWWLRELSKHDPDRVLSFVDQYGEQMKPFARKEALKKISVQ